MSVVLRHLFKQRQRELGDDMILTIVMCLVLILSVIAMFGFVTFAEKVITKPQLAPLREGVSEEITNL
jgi:hypothetical protein